MYTVRKKTPEGC